MLSNSMTDLYIDNIYYVTYTRMKYFCYPEGKTRRMSAKLTAATSWKKLQDSGIRRG